MALILGIESSCDETACALYDSARGRVVGERVRSQWALHAAYEGVVPELAARDHLAALLPMTDDLLREARATPDVVAYTRGPGLAAALLVGAATAQALALAWGAQVVAVNHLEGHLLSPLLAQPQLPMPYICLLASGGHSQLWRVDGRGAYRRLGGTLDDAAGEAFDKVAVLLGLGYPGGAALEKLAARSDGSGGSDGDGDNNINVGLAARVIGSRVNDNLRRGAKSGLPARRGVQSGLPALPSPSQGRYDFSFSGLKTAVKRLLAAGAESPAFAAAVAAEFQRVVAAGLARQAANAMRDEGVGVLAAVGGVACNDAVAAALEERAAGSGIFTRPHKRHCSDNAAMIALAAAHQATGGAGGFDIAPKWQPESAR